MVTKTFGFLLAYAALIVPAVMLVLLIVSPKFRAGARIALRLLARPLLLVAVVALVWDGTRSLAGDGGFVWTPLVEHWQALAPRSLNAVQSTVTRLIHPNAWEGGLLRLLGMPAWLILGILGFMLAWIGRRRRQVEVFVN